MEKFLFFSGGKFINKEITIIPQKDFCKRSYVKFLEEKEKKEKEKKKVRINKAGGGRDSKITKEEQIILTLIYLRHHLSFQLLGLMFRISESAANNIFHYWQTILRISLTCFIIRTSKKVR